MVPTEPEYYLDHATTSWPKAPGVADAMARAVTELCGTPGHSHHLHAREGAALCSRVRKQVAALFKLPDPGCVVFTSGATEALNLAIKGTMTPGGHAVTTCFEHNSVLRPLARMQALGCRVTIVPASIPDERLVRGVVREFRPDTRLLVISQGSNVCGTLLPWEDVALAARERGIPVLLDAA